MKCPICGSENSRCKDSRQKDAYRIRDYICFDCNRLFRTMEQPIEVKKKGRYVPFQK